MGTYSLQSIKAMFGGSLQSSKIKYGEELNSEQYEVVMHDEGPALVLAGAGAGKTRAITYRVARLIENGVNPNNILLLTFTKKASNEMLDRASKILDERCKSISGGTYHSFASHILRKYGSHIGVNNKFTVLDSSDCDELIAIAVEKLGLNSKGKLFPKPATLRNIFSSVVNIDKSIETVIREKYDTYKDESLNIKFCLAKYTELKANGNMLDYDDLLVKLEALLRDVPHVRELLSNQFKYIMVDEYQDSNAIQSRILKLLCHNHKNIMVVGDEQQSIYKFRGAKFENIMDFPNQYEGCKTYLITENYRSTQGILNLANAITSNATEKFPKQLFTSSKDLSKPTLVNVNDSTDEAYYIISEITNKVNKGECSLNDIAILCRNAYNSAEIEMMLNHAKIPFKKVGGIKFLEQAHIRDYIAFLRILNNEKDVLAWMRVLKLIEGLGTKGAEKIASLIEMYSLDGLTDTSLSRHKYFAKLGVLRDFLEEVKKLEFHDQIGTIYEKYYKYRLIENYKDEAEKRGEDFPSMLSLCSKYKDLDSLLSALVLEDDIQSNAEKNEEENKDVLTLSTMHSSKGLEWGIVFILSCVEGVLPSGFSFEDDEIEEERRLFYVAVTRAKKELHIMSPKFIRKYKGTVSAKESRFLKEFGVKRCLNIIKVVD